MKEPERERGEPAIFPQQRDDVVRRRDDDGRRDRRFGEAGREADDVERGEAQRERVRHRERGHDPEDVPEHRAKARQRLPARSLGHGRAPQDGRQEQREQKEEVIVPLPDVVDADADDREELSAPAHRVHVEVLAPVIAREGERARRPRGVEMHDPAVLRVSFEEELVVEVEAARLARARVRELEDDVGRRRSG